ncbi:MAG: dynamin family protein [Scytonema sp. PMC 1069.18]|nr:dynamin family protein [Scytonema sp. PMC 1069.18]MEC4886849.1 dynamin family protein [Scytonema sp. PMC 1070.18]
MDFVTGMLLAVAYAIAKSALERVGERMGGNIGDIVYDKFLEILEQQSPNTAIAIREASQQPLDYRQLFQEVASKAQADDELAETAQKLALTAKEHPLPNLGNVLQDFAVVEELKPQISELQSLISVWRKKMVNIDEIKQFLPDATDEQVQRYATQVKRLGGLESFFYDYSQELNSEVEEKLARARKAFNYKQPYRIAVIGTTGAGKSTMLNAMLGRELVLTKSIGKAATGAALEIFLDVSENQDEKAVVTYRDKDSIYQLINDHFVKRYQLDGSKLNSEIDASFSEALSELQMKSVSNDQAHKDFEDLKKILVNLTEQYVNNHQNSLRTHFSLNNPTDCSELKELTDENSEINRLGSRTRIIGLVKSVTYHIKADKNFDGVQTLQLPNNVCLVDLPGLDGSPLHDIIISEGIKDADAVIFIMRPPRILGRSDDYLLDRVSKYISLKEDVESGERIFLVLNAKDLIMSDDMTSTALKQDMTELMTKLLPKYADSPLLSKRGGDDAYFMTSALAAYYAQKKLKEESIQDKTYEAIKVKLGVQDKSDQEVLKISQVPKLIEELTKFARDKRIEGQIRDGKQVLDEIIESLYSKYDSEYKKIINNQGQFYFQKQVEIQLEDRRKVFEKELLNFRMNILKKFEELRKKLENQAKSICDEADKKLQEKMPDIWKKHFKTGIDILEGGEIGKVIFESVLSEAQVELWDNLNQRVPRLAKFLIHYYEEEFQRYQMVQKIVSCSYGYKEVLELEAIVKKFIDDMDGRMFEIAERIAMTKMTDPATHFTASDNDKPHKQQLFQSLHSPALMNESVPANEFTNFIVEVRKLYDKFVSDYCISGLLNLYRYEMLGIERYLCTNIGDLFTEMRNKINDNKDSGLISRIRESNSDPTWDYVASLESKIATLFTIK